MHVAVVPILLFSFVLTTTPAASSRRNGPPISRRGGKDFAQKRRIDSSIPNIGFRVHGHDGKNNNERYLAAKNRDNDDDDYAPNMDPPDFEISFDVNAVGNGDDVCASGCEGEYDEVINALEELWNKKWEEYELFFLPQQDSRYAVAAGCIYDHFEERVTALRNDYPAVDTLVLVDVYGSCNDDALVKGARKVHELGYKTCVPSNGHVASGGTDFFLSGKARYATPGAKVGIHSWSSSDGTIGSQFPKDHKEHDMYLDLFEDVCIPLEFYWETLSVGLPMLYVTEEQIDDVFPYMRDCTMTAPAENDTPPPTGEQQHCSYDYGCRDKSKFKGKKGCRNYFKKRKKTKCKRKKNFEACPTICNPNKCSEPFPFEEYCRDKQLSCFCCFECWNRPAWTFNDCENVCQLDDCAVECKNRVTEEECNGKRGCSWLEKQEKCWVALPTEKCKKKNTKRHCVEEGCLWKARRRRQKCKGRWE